MRYRNPRRYRLQDAERRGDRRCAALSRSVRWNDGFGVLPAPTFIKDGGLFHDMPQIGMVRQGDGAVLVPSGGITCNAVIDYGDELAVHATKSSQAGRRQTHGDIDGHQQQELLAFVTVAGDASRDDERLVEGAGLGEYP
jgi:hypothetical protein